MTHYAFVIEQLYRSARTRRPHTFLVDAEGVIAPRGVIARGATDFIKAIREASIPFRLRTEGPRCAVGAGLRRLGLEIESDLILGEDKPIGLDRSGHEAIFEALKLFDVPASRLIVIAEPEGATLRAAVQLGCRTVAVSGERKAPIGAIRPDLVLESLEAIDPARLIREVVASR